MINDISCAWRPRPLSFEGSIALKVCILTGADGQRVLNSVASIIAFMHSMSHYGRNVTVVIPRRKSEATVQVACAFTKNNRHRNLRNPNAL